MHTGPTKCNTDVIAHLEELHTHHGPEPGRPRKPVVLVEDNGPIRVGKLIRQALEARKHCLTVAWLPKYALNNIEVVWHDLKAIISPITPSPTPSTAPSRPASPP